MTSGTLLQFVRQTLWQELDFLIVDLPPGTGDAQLTLAHSLKTDGLLVVTTPQEVALGDVRRAVAFYQERQVPILGLIENMSGYVCEHCEQRSKPFQRYRTRRIANDPLADLPVLARIPLAPAIAASGDHGVPLVLGEQSDVLAELYRELAAAVLRRLPEVEQVGQSAAADIMEPCRFVPRRACLPR
jgi:ATP-binding protein involved in chromosome partitioning